MTALTELLLAHFKQADIKDTLTEVRQKAIGRFETLGIPTTKHEEWKYTNLKNLATLTYNLDSKQANGDAYKAFTQTYDEQNAYVIVIANGKWVKELSQISDNSFTISNLDEAQNSNAFKQHYGKYASFEQETFVALNTALVQEGVFIHVPAGKILEKPIIVHFIADAQNDNVMVQQRVLLVAEKGSHCTLIEHFSSTPTALTALTNHVTEVFTGQNAFVEHYKLQTQTEEASQINYTNAYLQRDAKYHNTTLTLSGKLVRNNLSIKIDGENCEAFMNGLYAMTGNSHVDNHTAVDHAIANSYSNELYKGLLDQKASGVFNGKIFVRQDAQKTNAYQSNKNILLSPTASMDTKPQLEIWANDVKCSHGCTVGALDQEPLFYLRARGIDQQTAKAMLILAYAEDVLDRIKYEPVRAYVQAQIAQRLQVEF